MEEEYMNEEEFGRREGGQAYAIRKWRGRRIRKEKEINGRRMKRRNDTWAGEGGGGRGGGGRRGGRGGTGGVKG